MRIVSWNKGVKKLKLVIISEYVIIWKINQKKWDVKDIALLRYDPTQRLSIMWDNYTI